MASTWKRAPHSDSDDWIRRSAMPLGTKVAYAILRDDEDPSYWRDESSGAAGVSVARFHDKSERWKVPLPVPAGQAPWEKINSGEFVPPRPLYAQDVVFRSTNILNQRELYHHRFLPESPIADLARAREEASLPAWLAARVEHAWGQVSEPGRTYLHEQIIEGLTLPQIAGRHGVDLVDVRRECRRARKDFKTAFGEYNEETPNA